MTKSKLSSFLGQKELKYFNIESEETRTWFWYPIVAPINNICLVE